MISEILVDQMNQAPRFFCGSSACAFTLASMFMVSFAFKKRQVVPAFQLGVNPGWNRQNFVHRPHLGTRAEIRRNQIPHDLRVERVARDGDTGVAQQIAASPAPAPNGWADVISEKSLVPPPKSPIRMSSSCWSVDS